MQAKHAKLAAVCSLVLVLVLLVGCKGTPEQPAEEAAEQAAVSVEKSVLDEIRERGKLRMAIYLSSGSPLQRPNETTAEAEGYLADVGRLMAEDLGVEAEFVDSEWKSIIPSLLSGKVDLIIAAASATPERALSVDFAGTIVYYNTGALIHKDGRIKTLEDLDQPGVKIAVNEGTTHHFYAMQKYPNAEIITTNGAVEARLEVQSQRADANFSDLNGIIEWTREYPETDILKDENGKVIIMRREPGSVAIRQGDPRFYKWLKNWTEWYWEQGILDAMYDKWMSPIFEGVPMP